MTTVPARTTLAEPTTLARRQEMAAAFGVRALRTTDAGTLLDDAAAVVRDALGADLAGVLQATADPAAFRFRSGIGWRDGVVGAVVPAQPNSAICFMLGRDEPVIYDDLPREQRFVAPRMLLDHGVRSGIGVIMRSRRRGVLGVLGVHSRRPHAYTPDDAHFLQTIANVLSEALERAEAEARLRAREDRFRRLAENAHDLIYRYRLRPQPGFEYVNPAVRRVTGYSPAECYAEPEIAFRMIHPDDRAAMLSNDGPRRDTPALVRYLRKDGGVIWCELRSVPVYDDTGAIEAIECIARDVSERKRMEDQLRIAYAREHHAAQQLRMVDSMKNAFLQAVSHELRTPLAAVLGMAVTLEQRAGSLQPEDHDMLVARLAVNARTLDKLLSDLLDLDRLMRRTITPQRRPTLLLRLARDIATNADTGGRAVHVSGDDVVAMVDTPKVERIIENLLANAVRHTPPASSIWITVRAVVHGTEIVVEDDGPGIPDAMRTRVFEPFQGAPADGAYAPGTGIGLSLVAKFAELHDGRAWATERAGGGAAIHVLLGHGDAER